MNRTLTAPHVHWVLTNFAEPAALFHAIRIDVLGR